MSAGAVVLSVCGSLFSSVGAQQTDGYLSWNEQRVEAIGRSMRADGRVGGLFDTRILSTNRSYNYELRATWLTPEVVRASARLAQLSGFLSDDETKALVAEAESVGDTVVLVEIDPREGSGVIPLDWVALLQPKHPEGQLQGAVRGASRPRLRRVEALQGVLPRDYDYDLFWVVFPLVRPDGTRVFAESDREAELVVRINDKAGRVDWAIPQSIRDQASALANERQQDQ